VPYPSGKLCNGPWDPLVLKPGWAPMQCPSPARVGHPHGAALCASSFDSRNELRRRIHTELRYAGAYAREHWPVRAGAYTDGPARGLAVVDPWLLAERLSECSSSWAAIQCDGGAHGDMMPVGLRCKQPRLCPLCAQAGASERARAIVPFIDGRPSPLQKRGALLHVVLTHRDGRVDELETCKEAWERWLSAWERLRTGANGYGFRLRIRGGIVILETTGGQTKRTWHPHAHCLLELQTDETPDSVREWLAEKWALCSRLAALDARVGGGWDPCAGGFGRWAQEIAPVDRHRAAFQISKYACPLAEIKGSDRWAEWCSWSSGRRLVRWLGDWSGSDIRAWGQNEASADKEQRRIEGEGNGTRPKLGPPLGSPKMGSKALAQRERDWWVARSEWLEQVATLALKGAIQDVFTPDSPRDLAEGHAAVALRAAIDRACSHPDWEGQLAELGAAILMATST